MLSVVESLATVIKDPVHQVGLVPVRWQAILIVMLAEADIEGIATEVWGFVTANFEKEPALEPVYTAGQEAMKEAITQKVKNWFTQSGKGGFQAMLKDRIEEVRASVGGLNM